MDLNASRTRTEDLEAILRRCDHTGDQTLSYAEFNELVAYLDTYTQRSYNLETSPSKPAYCKPQQAEQ